MSILQGRLPTGRSCFDGAAATAATRRAATAFTSGWCLAACSRKHSAAHHKHTGIGRSSVRLEQMEQKYKLVGQELPQPAAPSGQAEGQPPEGGDGGSGGGSTSRLLNNMPAFLMDHFGSKHAAPVPGVVPLHWQDAQEEVQSLVDEAIKLTNKALGIDEAEAAAEAESASASGNGGGSGGSLGSGGAVASRVVEQMQSQGMAAVQAADYEEYTTVCNNADCGKRPEPGQRFPQCGHCKAAYCCRECQVADWRQHKLVCQPEKLRAHVPAEREALLGIKRAAVAQLAESLMGPLALAATAWKELLGRGVVVAYMSNLAYLASAAAKDKCQLYAFYFPERDYPSRVAQIPGLKDQMQSLGGKPVFKRFGDSHAMVIFMDQQFAVSMGLPLLPTADACRQVLKAASTEVQQMDVLCCDTVSGEVALVDFHSMVTTAMG